MDPIWKVCGNEVYRVENAKRINFGPLKFTTL